MSALLLCAIELPQALAQGTQIVTQARSIPLNFSQAKVTEGDGTAITNVQLTFAFTKQTDADVFDGAHPVTVSYTTQNGTATAGPCGTSGADYMASASTISFTGQLSQQVTVQVCGDALSEGDEQFALKFSTVSSRAGVFVNIEPNRDLGTVTITDNEPLPALSITPAVQVAEPTSGQAPAVFTVSLSGPINQRPVTVDFATAPGTAVAGTSCPLRTEATDYLTKTGTLTFQPPSNLLVSPQIARTQQISVPVCSDSRRIEGPETFFVTLTRPVNASLTAGGSVTSGVTSPKLAVSRGTATIN